MQSKSSKIGVFFMTAQAFYLLGFSLFWAIRTEIFAVSDYEGVTGQSLADALASGSKSAALWLETKRFFGIELIPIGLLMFFIIHFAYRKGEKWSWYGLLLGGVILWGSLIGYKIAIGYFNPNPSSLTFILGGILFLIGLLLPAREILKQ